MADQVVHIYSDAVANLEQSGGAWAALLTFGAEHRRAESGFEPEATLDRLRLLAVVKALECLTRPAVARISVAIPYLRHGVTTPKRTPDENDDLWERLAQAGGTHQLVWAWAEENADDRDPNRAEVNELATAALRKAERGPTIDAVLTEYLADLKGRSSPRALQKRASVIDTLRWSINGYSETPADALPASKITDQLGEFFYVLVHKEFASRSRLWDVKTVLPEVLSWFVAHGHVDAASATSKIDDLILEADRYIDLRKFVNALREFAGGTSVDTEVPGARWHPDAEYVPIRKVTADSITFGWWGDDDETVGPFAVPPEVAKLASVGWQILFSAVEIDGVWHLVDVVNGE